MKYEIEKMREINSVPFDISETLEQNIRESLVFAEDMFELLVKRKNTRETNYVKYTVSLRKEIILNGSESSHLWHEEFSIYILYFPRDNRLDFRLDCALWGWCNWFSEKILAHLNQVYSFSCYEPLFPLYNINMSPDEFIRSLQIHERFVCDEDHMHFIRQFPEPLRAISK